MEELDMAKHFKILFTIILSLTLAVYLLAPNPASAKTGDIYSKTTGEFIADLNMVILHDDKTMANYILENGNNLLFEINGVGYVFNEADQTAVNNPNLSSSGLYALIQNTLNAIPIQKPELQANYYANALRMVVIPTEAIGTAETLRVDKVVVDGQIVNAYSVDSKGNIGFQVSTKPISITVTINQVVYTIKQINMISNRMNT